jgi:hypothetical protein
MRPKETPGNARGGGHFLDDLFVHIPCFIARVFLYVSNLKNCFRIGSRSGYNCVECAL